MNYIKIHVYEDGDVELTLMPASAGHTFMADDLVYDQNEIIKGDLNKELIDYGFEADRAKAAIDECLQSQPGEVVKV